MGYILADSKPGLEGCVSMLFDVSLVISVGCGDPMFWAAKDLSCLPLQELHKSCARAETLFAAVREDTH